MSGWHDPDVTPVGGAPGARPPGPSAPLGPTGDPFGSRPTVRRRGWVRLVLGVLLSVAGIVVATNGILGAARAGAARTDDAVARAPLGAGTATTVTFTAPGAGEHTAYLVFGSGAADSERRERVVAATSCDITGAGGRRSQIRGDRQAVASDVGSTSSIGWFSTTEGRVTVTCDLGTLDAPDDLEVVVSPGKPSLAGDGVLVIVGGVVLALAGGALVVSGLVGSRRPVG